MILNRLRAVSTSVVRSVARAKPDVELGSLTGRNFRLRLIPSLMNSRVLVSSAIAWLPLLACTAEPAVPAPPIDAVVARIMQEQQLPGVAVAVMRQGQIAFAKGYGYANLELQAPVQPTTVFQSASVGKMFTATAIMLLVEDGRLNLDDKVTQFFAAAPPSWRDMTVGHLLSHTSGLSEDAYSSLDLRQDYSDDQLLKIFQSWPLDFVPGTSYRYSNSGYVLLGMLVKERTGQFYGDFLQKRVFQPARMTSARVNDVRAIVAGRASGYVLAADGTLRKDEWVSPSLSATADGSLLFTVLDLAKWDAALWDGILLKPDNLQQMWQAGPLLDGTRDPTNYGFGWATSFVRGHRMVAHSGSWQGFTTYLARYVDDGLSVAVLTNLGQGDPGRLAHAIAGTVIGELVPYTVIADTDPVLTARLQRVLCAYLDGRIDESGYTTAALENWNHAQHRRDIHSIGKLNESADLQLVEQRRDGARARRVYRIAETESRPSQLVRFALTLDGAVHGLSFQSDY